MMKCFNDFSVLSWNVRGARSKVGRRHVKNLVQKFKPSTFIVLETHIPFRKVVNFWRGLGYKDVAIFEAQGQSGGIWVLEEVGGGGMLVKWWISIVRWLLLKFHMVKIPGYAM